MKEVLERKHLFREIRFIFLHMFLATMVFTITDLRAAGMKRIQAKNCDLAIVNQFEKHGNVYLFDEVDAARLREKGYQPLLVDGAEYEKAKDAAQLPKGKFILKVDGFREENDKCLIQNASLQRIISRYPYGTNIEVEKNYKGNNCRRAVQKMMSRLPYCEVVKKRLK